MHTLHDTQSILLQLFSFFIQLSGSLKHFQKQIREFLAQTHSTVGRLGIDGWIVGQNPQPSVFETDVLVQLTRSVGSIRGSLTASEGGCLLTPQRGCSEICGQGRRNQFRATKQPAQFPSPRHTLYRKGFARSRVIFR